MGPESILKLMHETRLAAPPFAEDADAKGRFKTAVPDHVGEGVDVTPKPQPILRAVLIRSEIDATRHGSTPLLSRKASGNCLSGKRPTRAWQPRGKHTHPSRISRIAHPHARCKTRHDVAWHPWLGKSGQTGAGKVPPGRSLHRYQPGRKG